MVFDQDSKQSAIIDSVLDFDYASGAISYDLADQILAYIQKLDLDVAWHIETHVHADHLSAAPYLQDKVGGQLMISREITEVQKIFGKVFNAGTEFERDGSQFNRLLMIMTAINWVAFWTGYSHARTHWPVWPTNWGCSFCAKGIHYLCLTAGRPR